LFGINFVLGDPAEGIFTDGNYLERQKSCAGDVFPKPLLPEPIGDKIFNAQVHFYRPILPMKYAKGVDGSGSAILKSRHLW